MISHVQRPGWRFRDHLDPKVADWIQPYPEGDADRAAFDLALLGAPLSKTSISHSAAFQLPAAIRSAFQSLTPYSVHHRLDLSQRLRMVDLGDVRMHLTDLARCHEAIEGAVASYWSTYQVPLVMFGGDHSTTGCAVLGLARATERRIGIVHFDAHHDVRNLEDGGRHNGTPFRTLLESGRVKGEHIVQIGLRDFVNAKAYHEYVLAHGVSVITARQVRRRGLAAVVEEAWRTASRGTDMVYISFDMDVMDQSVVPGVPAPSPGGLQVWEAVEVLEWLGAQSQAAMMDIVCADPTQDVRDLTTRVAAHLALSFMTGVALRPDTPEPSGDV
ncbi:agmatinase family protein [Alicyclobacillus kakegawensis]|uniref:agmatinase family protein n=1 Tax=Alicyclobacillus kakegawensis TaxID=392012 RepID=UPI000833808A|nr:agmatinase family protein [Alicyclobacillus kakegawensis]